MKGEKVEKEENKTNIIRKEILDQIDEQGNAK